MPDPAVIVLEDGVTFTGEALVGAGSVGGELVFTTDMCGYQEIVTDPAHCGQLITFTFPMNGDYGADAERDESDRAHARAIIAREITNYRFNRASRQTWLDWLAEHGVLAVTGVDTRAVTRHLRDKGALRAVVSTEPRGVKELRRAAQRLPLMAGLDLARVVACREPYAAAASEDRSTPELHLVACDFGLTRSLLARLTGGGFRVTVVPGNTSAQRILRMRPDGVLLSTGPGDPAAVTYAVKAIERLHGRVPLLGVGLGHQLLARALGFDTYKLASGHRGANHPVKDLLSGGVEITTQDHGFAVREKAVVGAQVTHVNLNDGGVEGLAAPEHYALSVQYRPDPTPDPRTPWPPLERFRREIERSKHGGGG